MSSWSSSDSCWLWSIPDGVTGYAAELKELCVPIHGALTNGTSPARSNWKSSVRCSQDCLCSRTIRRDARGEIGVQQVESSTRSSAVRRQAADTLDAAVSPRRQAG